MKHATASAAATHFQKSEPAEGTRSIQVFSNKFFQDHQLPLNRYHNQVLKRCIDLIGAGVLIIFIMSWLFPLLALLIRLDSKGPVLFLQKRKKRGGGLFTCFKFRSMYINAEADELPATANDRRITRCGKFLRKHHLDELPQLFNVLSGEMSLIGPRPHMQSDNQLYEALLPDYQFRSLVKPGITGLAQVSGHAGRIDNTSAMQERLNHDINYMLQWSPSLDGKIACRTLLKMVRS